MHLARRLLLVLVAALPMWPATGQAQAPGGDPFVFVLQSDRQGRSGDGLAWWLRSMIVRPTGTSVSGISLESLNAELGPAADPWCYANPLTPASFVSPFREIQSEIEGSLRQNGPSLFHVTAPLTGGPVLDAVVGKFETCGGEQGTFLLITDPARPTHIAYLHAFEGWEGLIWLSHDGGNLIVSSCFECGHAEALFHDRARQRFYWENVGD